MINLEIWKKVCSFKAKTFTCKEISNSTGIPYYIVESEIRKLVSCNLVNDTEEPFTFKMVKMIDKYHPSY
jgi:hypothetical protein